MVCIPCIKGRPKISTTSNQLMNYVDKFDSSLNKYLFCHKKTKWNTALLINFQKISLVNAWFAFKNRYPRQQKLTQLQFLIAIIGQKLGADPELPSSTNLFFHITIKVEESKRCVYCAKTSGIRTPYQCPACDVYLHPHCIQKYNVNKR